MDSYDGIVLAFAYHDLGDNRFTTVDLVHSKLSADGVFVSLELSFPNNSFISSVLSALLRLFRKVFSSIKMTVLVHMIDEILTSPLPNKVITEIKSRGFTLKYSKIFLLGLIHMCVFTKEKKYA